jgi:preprotein translocase subunit SecE
MTSFTTENTAANKMDVAKLVLAGMVIVAGLVGYYYFSERPLYYRVIGIIIDVLVALFLVSKTEIGRLSLSFIRESQMEVRKVVWPTRQETVQSTLMVCVLVFIVGIFLWLLDMLLFWGIGFLTGQKV